MQRNKYLDDLGIPIEKYGVNHTPAKSDGRRKRWKKQRLRYGFDDRETWNLDMIFCEFLYSHLMMYKEIGGKVIKTDFHKFDHNGTEVTQGEAIDIILEACKDYLLDMDNSCDVMQDAMVLWGKILPAMWW